MRREQSVTGRKGGEGVADRVLRRECRDIAAPAHDTDQAALAIAPCGSRTNFVAAPWSKLS
ncbi:hypothetical protein FHX15_006352 [Rhizobium sp. BK650]|nr:hypothetical protein [Rhizobium sp. BK650]